MNEVDQLIATLKRLLKAQGHTYRHVAQRVGLSEASVKRLFARGGFTLERLVQLAEIVGLSLAELTEIAAAGDEKIHHLEPGQEAELISDSALLLMTVCVINHWTLAEMIATYRFSEAECLQRLLRLDRMGLICLLPGNRVRLLVARDFEWLPDGPIKRFFREQGEEDFLAAPFNGSHESLVFTHGMLTQAAAAQFQGKLRRLRQEFAELHEESLQAPWEHRFGHALLLAMRNWEPKIFQDLRRQRD